MEMISDARSKIASLTLQKENLGATWTNKQIENHCKMIEQDISQLETEILELEEALQIKRA